MKKLILLILLAYVAGYAAEIGKRVAEYTIGKIYILKKYMKIKRKEKEK
jgi:hypothetical protein